MKAGWSPCASCKQLRRGCSKDCIFAPFFPPNEPHKFSIVHKVFGASNFSRILRALPVHQREDAVTSLVYEANARVHDPVYGCVGTISFLQNQLSQVQMQLAETQAELLCIQIQQQQQQQPSLAPSHSPSNQDENHNNSFNRHHFSQHLGFLSPSSVIQEHPHYAESHWS